MPFSSVNLSCVCSIHRPQTQNIREEKFFPALHNAEDENICLKYSNDEFDSFSLLHFYNLRVL